MKIIIGEKLKYLLVAIALFSAGWFGNSLFTHKYNKFTRTLDLVSHYYYPDGSSLSEDFYISSLLSSFEDPNTYYASPDEYEYIQSVTEEPVIKLEKHGDVTYYLSFNWIARGNSLKNTLVDTIENTNTSLLVMDLRLCTGGNVDSTLSLLDTFINKSDVWEEHYLNNSHAYHTTNTTPLSEITVEVVTSKETSSSCELLAGALQKNGVEIWGETTYGKNTIGNFFEFSDQSAIHLTTGKWKLAGDTMFLPIEPNNEIPNVNELESDELLEIIMNSK